MLVLIILSSLGLIVSKNQSIAACVDVPGEWCTTDPDWDPPACTCTLQGGSTRYCIEWWRLNQECWGYRQSWCDINDPPACGGGGGGCDTGPTVTGSCDSSWGQGLWGRYYEYPGSVGMPENLKINRLDSNLDFDWGGNTPGDGLCGTDWGAIWQGYVYIPTAGTWTFYTQTDDAVQLTVNGTSLYSHWGAMPNPPTGEVSASINLPRGYVSFWMSYWQGTGGSFAKASYSGPSVSKRIIPSSSFAPCSIPLDFSLSLSPSSQDINAGSNASYSLTLSESNVWTDPINVSCTITGVNPVPLCSVSNNNLVPPASTTINITGTDVIGGARTLTVNGSSSGTTHSTTASMNVLACDNSFGATVGGSCPGGPTTQGIWASYYQGTNVYDSSKVKINRLESNINHLTDWTGGCPVDCNLMGSRDFGMKYKGYFYAWADGVYEFRGSSGSGSGVLSINGQGFGFTNSGNACSLWPTVSVNLAGHAWYPYEYFYTQPAGPNYPVCGGENCISLEYKGPWMGSFWVMGTKPTTIPTLFTACEAGCQTYPSAPNWTSGTTNPPACTLNRRPTWQWNAYIDPEGGKCPIIETKWDRDWITDSPDGGGPGQITSFTPTGDWTGLKGMKVKYTNFWGDGPWSSLRAVDIDASPPQLSINNNNPPSNYSCVPPSNAGTVIWGWNDNNSGCANTNLYQIDKSWEAGQVNATRVPPDQTFTAGANMLLNNFIIVRGSESIGTETPVFGNWQTLPEVGIDDEVPVASGTYVRNSHDLISTPGTGEGSVTISINPVTDTCTDCGSESSCAGMHNSGAYVIKLNSTPPSSAEWTNSTSRTFNGLFAGTYNAYLFTRDNYGNTNMGTMLYNVWSDDSPSCTIVGVPNTTNYATCGMYHDVQLVSVDDPDGDLLLLQKIITGGTIQNDNMPSSLAKVGSYWQGVPSGFTWNPPNIISTPQVVVQVSDDGGTDWVTCDGSGIVNVSGCTFGLSLNPLNQTINAGQNAIFNGTVTENLNWPNPISLSCIINNIVPGGTTPNCSITPPVTVTPNPNPYINPPIDVTLNVTNTTYYAGQYDVQLRGTSNGQTVLSTPPSRLVINSTGLDYGLNITQGGPSEPPINVTAGSVASVPVELTDMNGDWTLPVSLTCTVTNVLGLVNPTCRLQNSSLVPGPGIQTTVYVENTAGKNGTYTLTVNGSSNGVIKADTALLTISSASGTDFGLDLNPAQRSINVGGTTQFTMSLTDSVGDWVYPVNATCSITGPSAAVPTCTFVNNNMVPPNSTSVNITNTNVPAGTYTLTTTGTSSGGGNTATHLDTSNIILSPAVNPDCGMTTDPVSLQLQAGQSGQYTVNISSVGGYTSNVTVDYGDLSGQGITLSWAGGDNVSNYVGGAYEPLLLNVATSSSVTANTYDVVLTGVGSTGGVTCNSSGTVTASLVISGCSPIPPVPTGLTAVMDETTHKTIRLRWDPASGPTSMFWLLYKVCVPTPTVPCTFNTWYTTGPNWVEYCPTAVRYDSTGEPGVFTIPSGVTDNPPNEVQLIGGYPRGPGGVGCLDQVPPWGEGDPFGIGDGSVGGLPQGTQISVRIMGAGACSSGYTPATPVPFSMVPRIDFGFVPSSPYSMLASTPTVPSLVPISMTPLQNVPVPFQSSLTFEWSASLGTISPPPPNGDTVTYQAPEVVSTFQVYMTLKDPESQTASTWREHTLSINTTDPVPPVVSLDVTVHEVTDSSCLSTDVIGELEGVDVTLQSTTNPPNYNVTQQTAGPPSTGLVTFNGLDPNPYEYLLSMYKDDYISCVVPPLTISVASHAPQDVYMYRIPNSPYIQVNQGNMSIVGGGYSANMPGLRVIDRDGSLLANGDTSTLGVINFGVNTYLYSTPPYQDGDLNIAEITSNPPTGGDVYVFGGSMTGSYEIDNASLGTILSGKKLIIVPGNLTIKGEVNTIDAMIIVQNGVIIENSPTQLTINGELWVGGEVTNQRYGGVMINGDRDYIENNLLDQYAKPKIYWIRID